MKHRTAFTLIELLVVISVIGFIAAILLPVFARSREAARQAQCLSNLRQISAAAAMYAQDSDERFPFGADPTDLNGTGWLYTPYAAIVSDMDPIQDILEPYTSSSLVWRCPSDTGYTAAMSMQLTPILLVASPSAYDAFGTSYEYNTWLAIFPVTLSNVTAIDESGVVYGPSDIFLFVDAVGNWHGGTQLSNQRFNLSFIDGHVESLSADRTRQILARTIASQ